MYAPAKTPNFEQTYVVNYPHPLVDVLDAEPAVAMFAEPEGTARCTYDQFECGLTLLNAAVRGIPARENGFSKLNTTMGKYDPTGTGNLMPYYLAPNPELRHSILTSTWKAMQDMPDVADIAQLGMVIMAEGQFYSQGNKRLARALYGLGTLGYSGLPQERWNHSMSVYDCNPETNINFMGMHSALAGRFATATTVDICAEDLDFASTPAAVEPVAMPNAIALAATEVAAATALMLNEAHFNVPLAHSYLSLRDRKAREQYLTQDGRISAAAIIEDIAWDDFNRLARINNMLKRSYMTSMVSAFVFGESEMYGKPIKEFIAPYLPLPPSAHRQSSFRTANLLPIFSDYSSRV